MQGGTLMLHRVIHSKMTVNDSIQKLGVENIT